MSTDHKLAAIVFADIAGYTALMQKDEQKALEWLHRFQEVLERVTPRQGGRIVQYFGDGCLLAFDSSADSVNCAITLQKEFQQPPEVPVRIGIHQGDVLFQKENVFGDGVNLASRIESLGIPGAVLLSKTIRDNIANKKDYLLVSLGSFDFKNVSEPMEVFALANPGFVVPKREQMQGKLKPAPKFSPTLKWIVALLLVSVVAVGAWMITSKTNVAGPGSEKSIAVLPFMNMSAGEDQEYFSDGLSEELIHLLAKTPGLKVIGRTSSFSFKDKNDDLRSIGRKLGVAHLLEGSVRRSEDKLRVTAQLIKAADGTQLWSEEYDRDMEDVLKLQDEIARDVVGQLKIKLLPPANATTLTRSNPQIYNLILQGNFFLDKRDKESMQRSMSFYRQALAMDSMNAKAWVGVAKCYGLQATWGSIDYNEGYDQAEIAAIKAIELDPQNADAYRALGAVKMNRFDWKRGEADFNKALVLEPGHADAMRMKALLFRALGRYDEALDLLEKSLELDPLKPVTYLKRR